MGALGVPDRVGKDTGEGEVELFLGDVDTNYPWPFLHAELFNFNIDGNVLKGKHREFLDDTLIPYLHRERVHVELRGSASSSGASDYNQKLSLSRVLKVKEYLLDHGIPEKQVPGTKVTAIGETAANQKADDARDRAVRITIASGFKPLPIKIPKPDPPIFVPPPFFPLPAPPPPVSTNTGGKVFQMRHVAGVDLTLPLTDMFGLDLKIAAAGAGPSVQMFEIRDADTGITGVFALTGVTEGVSPKIPGIPIPTTPSVTLPAPGGGNWIAFEAAHQNVSDFEGDFAAFLTAGAGSRTSNMIVIPSQNVAEPIDTGFTIGAGANADEGFLLPVGPLTVSTGP